MGLTGNNSIVGLIGKVGTFVGADWKGSQVLRSLPRLKKSRNFTPAQLEQQARFKFAIDHIASLSSFVARTFPGVKGRKTAFNEVMAHVVNTAMNGSNPDYTIDWSKLIISKGRLLSAAGTSASVDGNNVRFTWGTGVHPDTNPMDKVIMVVYCPEKRACYYELGRYTRSEGTGVIAADYFAGLDVHAYIGFIDPFGRKASDSKYLGQLTLPA